MKFSLKRTTKTNNKQRQDGYSQYRASVVTQFQAIIEREIASLPYDEQVTAYEGLRLALLKARSSEFCMIGYETDDLMHLRRVYNVIVDAGSQFAYVAR